MQQHTHARTQRPTLSRKIFSSLAATAACIWLTSAISCALSNVMSLPLSSAAALACSREDSKPLFTSFMIATSLRGRVRLEGRVTDAVAGLYKTATMHCRHHHHHYNHHHHHHLSKSATTSCFSSSCTRSDSTSCFCCCDASDAAATCTYTRNQQM